MHVLFVQAHHMPNFLSSYLFSHRNSFGSLQVYTDLPGFSCPGVPIVPAVCIFVNIFLFAQVCLFCLIFKLCISTSIWYLQKLARHVLFT